MNSESFDDSPPPGVKKESPFSRSSVPLQGPTSSPSYPRHFGPLGRPTSLGNVAVPEMPDLSPNTQRERLAVPRGVELPWDVLETTADLTDKSEQLEWMQKALAMKIHMERAAGRLGLGLIRKYDEVPVDFITAVSENHPYYNDAVTSPEPEDDWKQDDMKEKAFLYGFAIANQFDKETGMPTGEWVYAGTVRHRGDAPDPSRVMVFGSKSGQEFGKYIVYNDNMPLKPGDQQPFPVVIEATSYEGFTHKYTVEHAKQLSEHHGDSRRIITAQQEFMSTLQRVEEELGVMHPSA